MIDGFAVSLARLIVYSMTQDSLPSAPSTNPTPYATTPLASGMNTPRLMSSSASSGAVGDYLTAHLNKVHLAGIKTHIGGSKALDSLVRLIASTESFFHPSNSGAWTSDVCRLYLETQKSIILHVLSVACSTLSEETNVLTG